MICPMSHSWKVAVLEFVPSACSLFVCLFLLRPPMGLFFPPTFYLFIYFWLRWVFVAAARGLSLVSESGATLRHGARASH